MKLHSAISTATVVALFVLSTTASAEWVEGMAGEKSAVQTTNNTSNESTSKEVTAEKVETSVAPKEKEDTKVENKVSTDKQSNPVIPSNAGQNTNSRMGSNMPWGNNHNRGGYPMRAMNPMGYGYAPTPNNSYYNMIPMMPPQQMRRPQPQQMFPNMPYEQQQAQMDMIRKQFEVMAMRVANAQKALAESHRQAQAQTQVQFQTPMKVPMTLKVAPTTEAMTGNVVGKE
ncbi:MAG: hypothetical protein KAH03_08035 [Cocleimonas sp.]|nr:hypothetical protein [Cocleimonas sp.]